MADFNIAEALKYAPKGLKLYCPIFGQVQLYKIKHKGFIELEYGKSESTFVSPQGKYFSNIGECLLFPSKDHRTWDNWQSVLFPQSVGSVCVTGTLKPAMFLCTPNGTIFDDNSGSTWDILIDTGGNYLKTSRYATPEESEQFFAELKANGYEWDAEKKEVRKIEPNKFDVSTLQPFDKVLVRDSDNCHWGVGLFAAYKQEQADSFICNAGWYSGWWKQCVPYNNNTKHLVGTTDDAPEFYKTWEYDK